ncbi:VanZ family protein [Paenibacillus zanthoxyli]|uniref:VanZ family protein n=1 Tax=Paenibacillus zanthoxyli TaxID=369399 RepID=UPI000471F234|nr:VanZ family protein [Paenibacillus zanthoxyli]
MDIRFTINIGIYASQNAWYKSINWIPFLTADLKSFMLNITMMLPFGFLWPLVSGRTNSWKDAGKATLILSGTIELVQFIIAQTLGSARSSDINDLIANTFGGIAGYAVLSLILKANAFRPLLQDGKASSR